jgi:4-hydroxy-tetrahydrodipicolinate synthase
LVWRPGNLSAGAGPAEKFSGIFAILSTPFDQTDQIDWEDLDREVKFCNRAGVQGLVWPQLAAEFYLLSEDERLRGAEVIVRAAAGRTPVVIGVQAPESHLTGKFARHAERQGASALISLPPYLGSISLETAAGYYHALAHETKLPIFIQNSGPPWGAALPTEFVIQLAKENPQFGYIKEEVAPVAHRIGEYSQSRVMKGIFSGNAGRNFLDDRSHGADGTMPACEFIDVDVQVVALAAQNKLPEARVIFEKLLPMINLEEIYGLHFVKEVLVRRRVFKTAKLRGITNGELDERDRKELDAWWQELAPYMRIQE